MSDFPVIFFSIPFEPDYENVFLILKKWGIEPFRDKRKRPVIIGGGPAVILNPRPLYLFFDALLIGEAEKILTEANWIFEEKEEIIRTLKEKNYSIIPGEKEKAKRVYLKDLGNSRSFSAIISDKSFFRMFLLEIQRGCPKKCRFCFLGHAYLPPRFMPFETIKEFLLKGKGKTKTVGFVGSAILSHPQIEDILKESLNIYNHISFSSMGLSEIIKKPHLMGIFKRGGVKTITIAPETGKNLRRKINKPYTDEDIYLLLKLMEECDIMSLKLYFMIGLPEETLEDIVQINHLLSNIVSFFKGSIKVTISIFVPKFNTPLAKKPFVKEKEIREKIKILKQISRKKRLHMQLPSYHHAKIETILARGDEEVGMALYRKVFYGESLRKNIDPEKYLFDNSYIEKASALHPVDTGVNKTFMEKELKNYHNAKLTPECQPEFCKLCGLCKGNLIT